MTDEELAGLHRTHELLKRSELIGIQPLNFSPLVEKLYDEGMPPGDGTGWPSVDMHYTVAPGQFTVLTGWPGSGKSEWLDALLLNLAKRGWRFAIFSPENQPTQIHLSKFIEKFLGKPFGAGPTARATKDEIREALVEMDEWFYFLSPTSDTERITFGIDDILEAAESKFRLEGIWRSGETKRGLVIDPWNEIEHARPREWSETEYISQTLGRIRAWARASNVHVWIVAHPQKLHREAGKLPIPRPDTISGSQHWWNKSDNAITVWRELDDPKNPGVKVYVWKVRFKHIGRPGVVDLNYDRVTGRYQMPPPRPVESSRADIDG